VINKKTGFKNLLVIVVLAILLVINAVVTLAYFTDRDAADGTTINFGTIEITTNKNDWFSTAENFYGVIKPGDKILANDLQFNLAANASAMYVRIKVEISSESTNSEVVKMVEYLQNDWAIVTNSESDYNWSVKTDGCYYLMNSDSSALLSVASVRTSDYIFSTQENCIIPFELEYDGELMESDSILIKITVEAIQSANVENTISAAATIFDLITD